MDHSSWECGQHSCRPWLFVCTRAVPAWSECQGSSEGVSRSKEPVLCLQSSASSMTGISGDWGAPCAIPNSLLLDVPYLQACLLTRLPAHRGGCSGDSLCGRAEGGEATVSAGPAALMRWISSGSATATPKLHRHSLCLTRHNYSYKLTPP